MKSSKRALVLFTALCLTVAIALLGIGVFGFWKPGHQASKKPIHYLIDPAAWGNRVSAAPRSGYYIVLGPRGSKTAKLGFSASWKQVRVEDRPPFSEVFAPAGRVKSDRTIFETEGLLVSAFKMRYGTYIWIENSAVQPREILVEGR